MDSRKNGMTNKLLDLTHAAGIQVDWSDARGDKQKISTDNLRTLLEALDLPCSSDKQCQDSRQRLEQLQCLRTLPPLVTGRTGLPLRLPAVTGLHGRRYRIQFEQGGQIEGVFPTDTGLLSWPARSRNCWRSSSARRRMSWSSRGT